MDDSQLVQVLNFFSNIKVQNKHRKFTLKHEEIELTVLGDTKHHVIYICIYENIMNKILNLVIERLDIVYSHLNRIL